MAASNEDTSSSQSLYSRHIENFNTYQFLWLDEDFNKNTEDNLLTQEKLRRAVHQLKVFENVNNCEEHIKNSSSTTQKLLLVISERLSKKIIPHIHDVKHLSAIYVLCNNETSSIEFSARYDKVKGVFTDLEKMIERIKEDQDVRERVDNNTVGMTVYSRKEGLEQRNAMFMHLQIFIDIILRMKSTPSKSKEDLLGFLRKNYSDNQAQLDLINKFEHEYTPEDAILWYSKATFLYGTVNKALRDHDFDVLIAFRLFLVDLYNQLSKEYQKFLPTLSEPVLRTYRGQGISKEELTLIRENVGEFMSMNSFLSTSITKNTGAFYADSSATGKDSTKRILFQFDIDLKLSKTRPFAYIRHLSHHTEEDEILIALGTIFRIKEVTYNEEDNMWIANLELCSEDDFVLKDILDYEKKRLGGTRDYISLGCSLSNIGLYQKAKNVFQQILNESEDDLEIMICYHYLIDINRYERNWDEAYKNYMKLPVPQVKNHPGMEKYIGYIHASIAELLFWKEDFDGALEHCEKSLLLIPEDNRFRLKPYHVMGTAFMAKAQYDWALLCLNKALDVQEKHFPKYHPSFGETYNYMAVTYEEMKDYSNALKFYNESLRIYKKSLPLSHEKIQNNENNLQLLQEKMKQP